MIIFFSALIFTCLTTWAKFNLYEPLTSFACTIPEHIMACLSQSSLQLRLAMWLGSRQHQAKRKVLWLSQKWLNLKGSWYYLVWSMVHKGMPVNPSQNWAVEKWGRREDSAVWWRSLRVEKASFISFEISWYLIDAAAQVTLVTSSWHVPGSLILTPLCQ